MTDLESNESLHADSVLHPYLAVLGSKKAPRNKTETLQNQYSLLIPKYIKNIITTPKTIENRISFDAPTKQTTFTYSITWEDDFGTEEKYRQILNARRKTTRPESNRAHLPTAKTIETYCDGPCNQKYLPNVLTFIGRCGHYLCNTCSKVLKNPDGTIKCSSIHCYWNGATREETAINYEREVYRIFKHLESNSSLSSSETNCSMSPATVTPETAKNEKIAVKLIIVEPVKKGFGVRHTYSELETPVNTKIRKVLECLLLQKKREPAEHLTNGVLYHAEFQPDSRRKLCRLKDRNFENQSISDFPTNTDTVLFVLDMTDFVMKKFSGKK